MKTNSPLRVSLCLGSLAACIAVLTAPVCAATVPLSGTMSAAVTVDLSPSGVTTGTGSSSASWTATPAALSVAASRTQVNDFGSSISAYANGTASWAANGNSGSAAFNYGWTIHDGGDYPFVSAQTGLNLPNWSYTFTAGISGLFTMDYNLTAPGGLPHFGGLQDFTIGTTGGTVLVLNATGSGTYTQAITAGSTYTVYFQNNGSIYDGLDNVGVQGTFNWTLPGGTDGGGGGNVPDTGATAALLALGLAVLGCARRGLGGVTP